MNHPCITPDSCVFLGDRLRAGHDAGEIGILAVYHRTGLNLRPPQGAFFVFLFLAFLTGTLFFALLDAGISHGDAPAPPLPGSGRLRPCSGEIVADLANAIPDGMLPLLAALRPEPLPWTAPRPPSVDLVAVAADTLRAWEEMGGASAPGLPVAEVGAVDATLRWVVRIGAEDAVTGEDRLADPAFLSKCVATLRWVPDVPRDGERLRLTRYLVYSVVGLAEANGLFQFPLWALPRDEAGLDPTAAEARRADLDRYRYTRQDVAAGVYRSGGAAEGHAEPLVWLTHEDHEQALLQGTVAVTEGAETRLYNVHRNNGIPYDKGERDTKKQRGYWYFRAIDAVRGWAKEPVRGPELRAGVAVAGDLEHIGFGRLLALKSADGLRLVVVADTGGAFVNNLHQLDLFTGVHPSAAAFTAATGSIGDTAAAWAVVPHIGDTGC